MKTINEVYPLFLQSKGLSTDSRTIHSGQIYAALKGANFDGNEMADKAILKGATYAIIDNFNFKKGEKYLVVNDVLDFIQQLALFHRKQMSLKALIAITGSNGKTTTKELINAVLSTTYKTHYTKENLNNHFGIPQTLLEMPLDTEIAIIEMGANHQKEIESYCKYVEPNFGIITNIGRAHLEGFGGIEGVKKGKGELYDYLKNNNGTVFYNIDSEIICTMIKEKALTKIIGYGKISLGKFHAEIAQEVPFLSVIFDGMIINSHLYGNYNFDNIMCAIAIGKYFEVSNHSIQFAIENYIPNNKRSEVIQYGLNKIFCDCYNANPTSMQHALENFSKSVSNDKVVILGDMFELGDYALQEHQRIADLAQSLNFKVIVLVGDLFRQTKTKNNVIKHANARETKEWFLQQNFQNTEILLKGSRSMKMEEVIS